LFPKGKYFGEIGLIGPANLINLHPIAGIDLGSGWSLSAAAVFYLRESLGDGVYGAPGNLLRASTGSRERYIGTQADVVLGWEPTRTLSFEVAYSVFEPGPFIKETGPPRGCTSWEPKPCSSSETYKVIRSFNHLTTCPCRSGVVRRRRFP
jgi:hypothetical protein